MKVFMLESFAWKMWCKCGIALVLLRYEKITGNFITQTNFGPVIATVSIFDRLIVSSVFVNLQSKNATTFGL